MLSYIRVLRAVWVLRYREPCQRAPALVMSQQDFQVPLATLGTRRNDSSCADGCSAALLLERHAFPMRARRSIRNGWTAWARGVLRPTAATPPSRGSPRCYAPVQARRMVNRPSPPHRPQDVEHRVPPVHVAGSRDVGATGLPSSSWVYAIARWVIDCSVCRTGCSAHRINHWPPVALAVG